MKTEIAFMIALGIFTLVLLFLPEIIMGSGK